MNLFYQKEISLPIIQDKLGEPDFQGITEGMDELERFPAFFSDDVGTHCAKKEYVIHEQGLAG